MAPLVGAVVAVAPPTHGTDLAGLYNLALALGRLGRDAVARLLARLGCGACNDLVVGGPAVRRLVADGRPVVQPGIDVTVVVSRYEEIVTPPASAFVREPGVHNIWVQDYCPLDRVGHLGVSLDSNVWHLVLNSLERRVGHKFACLAGPPVR